MSTGSNPAEEEAALKEDEHDSQFVGLFIAQDGDNAEEEGNFVNEHEKDEHDCHVEGLFSAQDGDTNQEQGKDYMIMNLKDLKALAKTRHVKGISKLKKEEIVSKLEQAESSTAGIRSPSPSKPSKIMVPSEGALDVQWCCNYPRVPYLLSSVVKEQGVPPPKCSMSILHLDKRPSRLPVATVYSQKHPQWAFCSVECANFFHYGAP